MILIALLWMLSYWSVSKSVQLSNKMCLRWLSSDTEESCSCDTWYCDISLYSDNISKLVQLSHTTLTFKMCLRCLSSATEVSRYNDTWYSDISLYSDKIYKSVQLSHLTLTS